VWVKDVTPPQDWRAFRCTATACAIEVRDVIAGLDTTSARYRISDDGGLSWGAWLPAGCTGVRASHQWETLTTSLLPALDPEAAKLQFGICDAARLPNVSVSPAFSWWRVFLPLVLRDAP
jgi:hypothetical protein